MKKIFAFLLLGLTVAFASCGDEKTETGPDRPDARHDL